MRVRTAVVVATGVVVSLVVVALGMAYFLNGSKEDIAVATSGARVSGPDQDGYLWVQKTNKIWPTAEGTGQIGQAVLAISRPGTYTFHYKVTNSDFIYLKELWVFVFPEQALKDRGIITSKDFVAMQIFPFSPGYDAVLRFTITDPGRYRVAFGPYNGSFFLKGSLSATPRPRANLGLKLEGPDGRIVDLESAYDLTTWRAPDGTIYVQENAH
uniref:Uncharacterized protein n=1 Tax=Acetithermum autotrophicum TaxID=1446466 RepID=H5SSK1_ACEAU|nr:hypothetical protein HGMM_OP3C292 [Candidatus Acetothermum autotrophicum]